MHAVLIEIKCKYENPFRKKEKRKKKEFMFILLKILQLGAVIFYRVSYGL